MSTPMKLAIITSSYPRYSGDGVGSFIHSLSKSLIHLGHHVTVLAPYDPADVENWQTTVDVRRVRFVWPESWSHLGHAQSLESDVRLKWHAYPLVALFSMFATIELLRFIHHEKPDVIYAQWLVPGGFIGAIASVLTGTPLIISLHGSDVFVAERYRLLQPIVRFIFRQARHIIACSPDLAQRTIKLGFPAEYITVIPYGVATEAYAPQSENRSSTRVMLGVNETTVIVMAMGRLVYKKGFDILIRAIPYVLKYFPETQFIIAGDGDLRTELSTLATKLHVSTAVRFIGHVPWDQTPAYLNAADILVVPSILDEAGNVDGLPNVLLEALASGCTIVASRIAGIPTVIQDGVNGLLVPSGDPQALAEALCQLLEDCTLRQKLAAMARQTAVETLSWEHIGQRVAAVLETSIESKV